MVCGLPSRNVDFAACITFTYITDKFLSGEWLPDDNLACDYRRMVSLTGIDEENFE